jgi:hypothetical protein
MPAKDAHPKENQSIFFPIRFQCGLARKFNREQTFAGTGEKPVVKVLSGTGRD